MKLRCIAVDDEKFALDFLKDNISRIPYLELVAACKNAFEAAEILHKEKIDLIIIDIQMPGLNGLQFIKGLNSKPLVIFITAYENYALDAFEVDAIDYLVKPVAFDRFLQAINKAVMFSSYNQSRADTETKKDPEFIFVNVDYNLVKVMLSDILYIEGMKDYVRIHFITSGKPLITKITMKGMQELLPANRFIRIHRSYIIALASIYMIKKDSILLSDRQVELPFSESYKDAINNITGKR